MRWCATSGDATVTSAISRIPYWTLAAAEMPAVPLLASVQRPSQSGKEPSGVSKWRVGFDEWRRKAEALEAENERLRAALQEIRDGIAPLEGWRMRLRETADRALARGEEASSG